MNLDLGNAGRIDDIIQSCADLCEEDRVLLSKLFQCLSDDQEKRFSVIQENVEAELRHGSRAADRWEVATALCPRGTAGQRGASPVLPEEDLPMAGEHMEGEALLDEQGRAGFAFLDCAYDELEGYREKSYHARILVGGAWAEASYHLRSSDLLLKREKLLIKAAEQYDLDRPAIFSPFSRRLVQVQLDRTPAAGQKIARLDLELEQNGLSNVLLTDRTLVWNVEIEEVEELPAPKRIPDPLGPQERVVYEFGLQDGEFLCVDGGPLDLLRVRRGHERILLDRAADQGSLDVKRVTIHPASGCLASQGPGCFRNSIDTACPDKARIRTKADLESAVRRSCPDGLRYRGHSMTARDPIHTYSRRDAYHDGSASVMPRGNASIFLRFQPEESGDMFFVDRVSYLTAYLNRRYPEFRWVGDR